jgi:hypothetical protein
MKSKLGGSEFGLTNHQQGSLPCLRLVIKRDFHRVTDKYLDDDNGVSLPETEIVREASRR